MAGRGCWGRPPRCTATPLHPLGCILICAPHPTPPHPTPTLPPCSKRLGPVSLMDSDESYLRNSGWVAAAGKLS